MDDSFLLCFNAHHETLEFVTPDGNYAKEWTVALDTAARTGAGEKSIEAGTPVEVTARSLLVLRKTA